MRLGVLSAVAGACAALNDRDLAAALYPELPCRDQFVLAQVSAIGPVAHYLGGLATVLGLLEEADAHFAHAEDLALRTGARGMLARTRLSWANVRRARGDHAGAMGLLSAAQELALALDAPDLAARAARSLADA